MSELGNKNAEKYPPERILEIVEDCKQGLASFESYEDKADYEDSIKVEDGDEDEDKVRYAKGSTKKRIITGYSCLKRALISNGIYDESKLHEWLKTHTNEVNKDKEDSILVSQAIKELLILGHAMLEINMMEGHYSPAVGIFLSKAVLGMSEDGSDLDDDDDFDGFEFVEVDENGNEVESDEEE